MRFRGAIGRRAPAKAGLTQTEAELAAELDRAYEREKVEREERRGLETRATTLLGSAVIAIGLIGAGTREAGRDDFTVLLLMSIPAAMFGVVTLALAAALSGFLADVPPDEDLSNREFVKRLYRFLVPSASEPPGLGDPDEPEPVDLVERLAAQRARVARIRSRNARFVRVVARSTVLFGIAVVLFAYAIMVASAVA